MWRTIGTEGLFTSVDVCFSGHAFSSCQDTSTDTDIRPPYPIILLISKPAWEAIWTAHQFLTASKKLDNLEGMVISGSTLPYKRQTGGVP